MPHQPISLALHGGAGTIDRNKMTPQLQAQYEEGLRHALHTGYGILSGGGSALDAVEATVIALENFPLFNAGKGSVFNHEGKHEMDACIMDGTDRRCGAVSGVSGVRNPIALSRLVMERSEHVLLSGRGAEAFAKAQGVLFEEEAYFYNELRYQQWQEALQEDSVRLDHSEKKFGTVGAVALDAQGHLAAATSTGGMTNKKWGRIGDSPIPGAGTWADDATCAISCTGHGEPFIRAVVAHDIACLMEYKGLRLAEACNVLVHDKLIKTNGEGGLVAVDRTGTIAMPFNSEGMYRAAKWADGEVVKIYKEE